MIIFSVVGILSSRFIFLRIRVNLLTFINYLQLAHISFIVFRS